MRALCFGLGLAAVVALSVVVGCGGGKTSATADKGAKGTTHSSAMKEKNGGDDDTLELEEKDIDVVAGGQREVKLKKGKAEKVEVPEGAKLSVKAEGKKLTITVDKEAEPGKSYEVTVKGKKGKDAVLKVNIKKHR